MMEPDNNQIRSVAWTELFPWLRIVRVFRLAIAVRSLVFGAAAILLTIVGWGVLGSFFSWDINASCWRTDSTYSCNLMKAYIEAVPDQPILVKKCNGIPAPESNWRLENPMYFSWESLTQPAIEGISRTAQPPRTVASIILCGLWAAAVWAFFGAAICRAAAVQLAAEEQVGWGAAMRFAYRKWPSYFAAPLMPVGGIILTAIPVIVLGLIMRAGGFGVLLGGVFWPFALIAGFVISLLLLGVLFGWPLMWSAISAEGSDSFDALSRSYAYLFQRPLHYLFYTIVAAAIGWLGWLVVREFASSVVWMSVWAAGWGSGGVIENPSGMEKAGCWLIGLFSDCVRLLALGYLFSYFWSASAAIYLLLRRDVDATEMDEVYLDADGDEEPADLPAIGKDSAGAPVAEGDADLPDAPESPDNPSPQL